MTASEKHFLHKIDSISVQSNQNHQVDSEFHLGTCGERPPATSEGQMRCERPYAVSLVKITAEIVKIIAENG